MSAGRWPDRSRNADFCLWGVGLEIQGTSFTPSKNDAFRFYNDVTDFFPYSSFQDVLYKL